MENLLNSINSPEDVKRLSDGERGVLCDEIREFLIDSVSETGGHLASNLGAVELSVALHTVFDVPRDKIVWDVGHQSYVHKILTGRKEAFKTLRKYGGLSGFPKTNESEADCFNTGHSSTSISAALGMARARDLKKEKNNVIAVLGDGALTGGMVWEALNDAGRSKTRLIIILNDNNMSISKNVGAFAKYLQNLRTNPSYIKSKETVGRFLAAVPMVGEYLTQYLNHAKKALRFAVYKTTMFEDMGFYYIGPVDGHDVNKLVTVLEQAKKENKPVFIHVCTKKGKGYAPAEENPSKFHGIAPFDKDTGLLKSIPETDYSKIFGERLAQLGETNAKIVAITGAMPIGTGVEIFGKSFKERFFDVGIAEQHGVTLAAGMAISGMIPVIPLYSSFMQRAYDQILHDVCLQGLHVVFPVDRAGVVGADGETHQGVFDISFLSHMPNMTVLSPASFAQLECMLEYAVNEHDGPIAIRYPRGNTQSDVPAEFEISKCQVLRKGREVTVAASGRMVKTALEVAKGLEECEVLAFPVLCPLDKSGIVASAMKSKLFITIEDNVLKGGFGEQTAAVLKEEGIEVAFKSFGFPNEPIVHGSVSEIDRHYGVDAESILKYIKSKKEAL